MTFATDSKLNSWVVMVVMVMILLLGVTDLFAVSYTVLGYVNNSDGSAPGDGDITITAYLKKYPAGAHVIYNTGNQWGFDIDPVWTYYPGGDGGENNANEGDSLIVEFLNTNSGSPFFGEAGEVRDIIEGPGSFKYFTAEDYSLPVELSSFDAKVKDQSIFLSWTTQSERDNLGFNIYKSTDNGEFGKLNYTLIQGAGTSTYAHDYEYVDLHVENGHTFSYRLESVDINGDVHSYHTISISMDEPGKAAIANTHQLFQNYPNPFNPVTTISYSLNSDAFASLAIYNVIGDLIVELVDEYQATGMHSYQWNGRDASGMVVPSGLYFYKLQTNQSTLVQRMILSK